MTRPLLTALKGRRTFLLLPLAGLAAWLALGAPPFAVAQGDAKNPPAITLYATGWCAYCVKARAFFAANGLPYVERDIEKSAAAFEEHRRLGGVGVPLIVVGRETIHGFKEERLRTLLAPWLPQPAGGS